MNKNRDWAKFKFILALVEGLSLMSAILTRHFEQWVVDEQFICTFWFNPSKSAKWHWSIFAIADSSTKSGNVESMDEAKEAINVYLKNHNRKGLPK